MIDHHHQPETFPAVLFSDTTMCSTAQMIYMFIESMGDVEVIDENIGACLYCGIMTDTGSFRFPSVTPKTHEIAADLIRKGVDHAQIHRNVYDTNLLDRLRLVGYALSEKLMVFETYHTAIISLTKEELTRFNYRPGDTEGLVNQALSIKGVNFAVFVREGNNEVKLSFRSQGKFDVNSFARAHFNGGGHFNAAGGMSVESIDVVLQKLKDLLPENQEQLTYTL
jgi:bifunctional oligoribonuclease and PAP phosphatase NrnA